MKIIIVYIFGSVCQVHSDFPLLWDLLLESMENGSWWGVAFGGGGRAPLPTFLLHEHILWS